MDKLENLLKQREKLSTCRYYEYFGIEEQIKQCSMSKEEAREVWEHNNMLLEMYMDEYTNKYCNIPNFNEKLTDMFRKGDRIVIQEKLDGSNAHINRANLTGFSCYSQNYLLNSHNHLRGFFFWCQDHAKDIPLEYCGWDIYGEWLVPHHCEYKPEMYGDFYVFDVMHNDKYMNADIVRDVANNCGFKTVDTLYDGEFISWEHILSFVGKSYGAVKSGEGIVVKNQTRLNDKSKQFYIKIVDTMYQETNKSRSRLKTVNIESIHKISKDIDLINSIVTEARVRKIILKAIDNNKIQTIWSSLDDSEILKLIKSDVIRDCIKEELDIVNTVGMNVFGNYASNIIKELIHKMKELDSI